MAATAQEEIPDKIIVSLSKGDAKTLSGFFYNNVELVILEKDNVYSKAQAQQIVTKFFSDYKPEGFEIVHKGEGGSSGSRYVIGTLLTKKGKFRVYFFLKADKEKLFIHQLHIEK